jgi:hypothetical protein
MSILSHHCFLPVEAVVTRWFGSTNDTTIFIVKEKWNVAVMNDGKRVRAHPSVPGKTASQGSKQY